MPKKSPEECLMSGEIPQETDPEAPLFWKTFFQSLTDEERLVFQALSDWKQREAESLAAG